MRDGTRARGGGRVELAGATGPGGILGRRAGGARERSLAGALMVVPALLFFAAFAIYPTIRVFYLSFFHYDLTSPEEWAGFENYQQLATDSLFHTAALNTAVYVIGTYVPVVVLAMVIAVGLNHRSGIAGVLRTAYFIPVAMSWVVVSVIWTLIFHPYGLANQVTGLHLNWLTDSRWAPLALVIMSIWKELGFFLIIFLAGLQSISRELYEAAAIDGAGVLRAHVSITLPLLRPVLAVASIFAVVRGMQAFTPQYVMTGGGPGAATEVLNLYVYKTAFTYAQMGKASAVAVLLFLVLLVATLLQLRVFRSKVA